MRQTHESLCVQYWGYKTVDTHSEASGFEEKFFWQVLKKVGEIRVQIETVNGCSTWTELQTEIKDDKQKELKTDLSKMPFSVFMSRFQIMFVQLPAYYKR